LPILTHLFDALGTQQGAQVIIAGAVAGILGAGGWPPVAIYASRSRPGRVRTPSWPRWPRWASCHGRIDDRRRPAPCVRAGAL
jgi:hypothetical protein